MSGIRSFIALPVADAVRSEIARRIAEWRNIPVAVRWVRQSGIHLTIKFLGDIRPEDVDQLGAALEKAAAGITCFDLDLGYLGAFPAWRRPRVIWIAPRRTPPALLELHQRVEDELFTLGYAREARSFSPHLTLGRVKSAYGLEQLTAQLRAVTAVDAGACRVGSINLYRSVLKPSGAEYEVLKSISLRLEDKDE